MKYAYTAGFSLEPGTEQTYNVQFPDLPGCLTFGVSIADAVDMAKDALCLWLYHAEVAHNPIPEATAPAKITANGYDFTSVISVDTEEYRQYYNNKLVKKTLNIPSWLNVESEAANINFSQTLQKALIAELGLPE